jgi:hypothetical protein
MSWWRSLIPQRTDDEISQHIAREVLRGAIKPELAPHYEKALRDELDGRAIVMRDPGVRPRPPSRPGQQSRRFNGL